MLIVALAGAGVVVIAGLARWAKRRWHRVDSYYEREYQAPAITDAGSWFGGDR